MIPYDPEFFTKAELNSTARLVGAMRRHDIDDFCRNGHRPARKADGQPDLMLVTYFDWQTCQDVQEVQLRCRTCGSIVRLWPTVCQPGGCLGEE